MKKNSKEKKPSNTSYINCDVGTETVMRLRRYCHENGIRQNFLVGKALTKYLDDMGASAYD